MRLSLLLVPVIALACRTTTDPKSDDDGLSDGNGSFEDGDGDGVPADEDCDDTNAAVGPDAAEICNGIDDNCDGSVDEGVLMEFWADADGDGFGDPGAVTAGCEVPTDHVEPGESDCDDTDSAVFPGASETCNGIDDDCDIEVDEGLGDVFLPDLDNDGWGDADGAELHCEAPDGFVPESAAGDCDDEDADVNPDATEVCNEVDDDCNELVDEGVTDVFYIDLDSDGWGAPDTTIDACAEPEGYATNVGDCDDADPLVNPDASEICNGLDDDCDSLVDDADPTLDTSSASTFYADTDSDGFGDAASTTVACAAPSGFSADATDCDDTDGAVFPGATEVCNAVDDDCDSLVDDADPGLDTSTASTWYDDSDGDGFGNASATTVSCDAPSDAVTDATDCDDTDSAVFPGATEVCNSVDDDCDSLVDDDDTDLDTSTASTWYSDSDSDGYGDASATTLSCDAPTGTVTDATDCDDTDSAVFPGATEVCNSVDDDCDSLVDDDDPGLDLSTASSWYDDDDGDGYGDAAHGAVACDAPTGTVSDDSDCDDADAAVYPGAPLACDGTDADCDGAIDNDNDGDGYAASTCGGSDCDDTDASIVPESDGSCAEGSDCLDLLSRGYTSSGTYTIDPDGYGTGESPFDVTCDMTTDGGGWTLAMHLHDMSGLDEDDFISLFGHNRFTDETWSYDASTGIISDTLPSAGMVQLNGQGMLGVDLMDGLWDDVRMACSASDDDLTETAYAQVDGYATTNGGWDLLGAASNGTSYSVTSSLQSTGQSTIWHDNELNTHNSNHYLCDIYNVTYSSAGGAPQFGFCYTDFLNNPNSSDPGDSIVTIAFGTVEGADGWSTGFTAECGNMGWSALQNQGTFSIWLR